MFRIITLSLALLAPIPPDEIPQSYVDLFDQAEVGRSDASLKALRSAIERERDEKINAAKRVEKQWKVELETARRELAAKLSSDRRAQLHVEIAALERGIKEKAREREETISSQYEARLARVWLLEHWPDRRTEILRHIDAGRARERRHGDVEDIGYRALGKNPEKDIEVGEQAARQMLAGGRLPLELQDYGVQVYVRRLAGKIAANSDLKVPLHVTVLDSLQPRAVALPGGFLYITSGVLRTARSESELAGVLSREIARMAAQHATRASKRSLISRMFMPVAQIATGLFSGGINPGTYYGIGYGMQGLNGIMDHMLSGSDESHQKEADQLGVQYAWKAGYDPRGFVGFLDALSADAKTGLIGKEPALPERLMNLFSEIEYLRPLEHPVPQSPEFDQARQRVITMSGS